MRFLDANVFLRYLTRDNAAMSHAAKALFENIEQGFEEAATCEAVITEIVFVLRSKNLFGLPAHEIRDRFQPVLSLPGLRVPHRDAVFRALDLMADRPSLDFADALCVAHMERLGLTEIYTFDRDFDRIEGVRRVTPGASN